ncbi:hypothetical protein F5Y06DRAFT_262313 [Hypoxylon sp. FL0890]|nr:hypothetical protein F5Y06DRAFT_262313 [Hypoxylon sp. FL0890]
MQSAGSCLLQLQLLAFSPAIMPSPLRRGTCHSFSGRCHTRHFTLCFSPRGKETMSLPALDF